MQNPKRLNEKGNVLIIVTLLIALFSILIPTIVMYIRNENKDTIDEKRRSVAFQLAEAAVDRGYWKLVEQTSNWETIIHGGTIAGYCNDVIYSDIQGGFYKINITGSGTQITITGTGKDSSSNKFKAIQVVYSRAGVSSAIQAPSIGFSGGAVIHWGPIMSTNSISLAGNSNELYPRKFSRGAITAAGTYPDRDNSPAGINTDNLEWWSYNYPPGVPDIPTPKINDYRIAAQAAGTYWDTAQGNINNLQDNVDRIRFYESDAAFKGTKHFRGILIVMGNCAFSGGAKGTASYGDYTTTPPADAWKEYQKNCPIRAGASDDGNYSNGANADGDSAAQDEYDGDGGYHTVKPYTFTSPQKSVAFKGFIFCAGDLTSTGTTIVHGAVMVSSGGSVGSGGFEVYYDNSLSIEFSDDTPTKSSWQEIIPTPF